MVAVGLNLNITNTDACFECSDGSLDRNTNTGADCPKPSEAKQSLGGGFNVAYFMPTISKHNFGVYRVGNHVQVHFAPQRRMTGEVWVYQDNKVIAIHKGTGNYTYHDIRFQVEDGDYQVLPVAYFQGKIHFGILTDI